LTLLLKTIVQQQTLANLSSRAVDLSVQAGAQAAADVRGEIQTRAHFAPIAGAQRSILQHNANKIGSVVHGMSACGPVVVKRPQTSVCTYSTATAN
jgi:hypothetical protein